MYSIDGWTVVVEFLGRKEAISYQVARFKCERCKPWIA